MYIGAHVSIAGGFDKCIERASKMGSNCLMTFASSPRSLKYQAPSDKVIENYKKKKLNMKWVRTSFMLHIL